MAYLLLTGATGLLGSYLLRDCLRAGRRMAVLVRPSKSEPARERIEMILERWEVNNSEALPRPVVLEGDLIEPNLGLEGASQRWIARHCDAVLHNAASLTFDGNDPSGEPWLTNVNGTRQVLNLCRAAGIRQFHHVSTAYVCGLREGRILENELDQGQEMGNDYERSKVEAEKMVRSASFLDSLTFYRPSIIVGDSRTGYTTTFHGFYVPLKLAHTLVSKVVRGATRGQRLIEALGMLGAEGKNFVPVDWVSAATTSLCCRPECHGKTYHLTARNPVPLRLIAEVIQDAVETYSTLADESDGWVCDGGWFEATFREQMDIYRAYWRDDPRFDSTNTQTAAAHLPCPAVDRSMLMMLAKFAIDSNFGRRRARRAKPEFDVHHYLEGLFRPRAASPRNRYGSLGLEVIGPGGGQWELVLDDGRVIAADQGLPRRSSAAKLSLDSHTFRQLVFRQMTVAQAVRAGRVRVLENGLSARQLEAVLQAVAASGGVRMPSAAAS